MRRIQVEILKQKTGKLPGLGAGKVMEEYQTKGWSKREVINFIQRSPRTDR